MKAKNTEFAYKRKKISSFYAETRDKMCIHKLLLQLPEFNAKTHQVNVVKLFYSNPVIGYNSGVDFYSDVDGIKINLRRREFYKNKILNEFLETIPKDEWSETVIVGMTSLQELRLLRLKESYALDLTIDRFDVTDIVDDYEIDFDRH